MGVKGTLDAIAIRVSMLVMTVLLLCTIVEIAVLADTSQLTTTWLAELIVRAVVITGNTMGYMGLIIGGIIYAIMKDHDEDMPAYTLPLIICGIADLCLVSMVAGSALH